MTEKNKNLLSALTQAKESIKRKYIALKQGEADTESLVTQSFKPIIDPLTKIANKNTNNGGDDYQSFENRDQVFDDPVFQSQQASKEVSTAITSKKTDHTVSVGMILDNWLISPQRDKIYGPKPVDNKGKINFGHSEMEFDRNSLQISLDGRPYPMTVGILQLLFSKNPNKYTKIDTRNYKKMLEQSSAHLTVDGSRLKRTGSKYNKIISKIFPSGSGLSMSLNNKKTNYVYWNQPEELITRLRLLHAARTAGNSGVNNEIVSIYEELYEQGIIKTIPHDDTDNYY